jgi:CRISPR type III-A-associated protein Csm2
MAKDFESFKSFDQLGGSRGGGKQAAPGGQQSGGQHRSGSTGSRPSQLGNYLAGGYFDEKGHLRPEVFVDWPQKLNSELAKQKQPTTKNSLRGFYSMLRMAKNQFDSQSADRERAWSDAKTQLLKLRTAAQYQGTRQVISQMCQKDFLNDNIDLVLAKGTDPEKFREYFNAFVEHFQAVIAYLPERP